jgi:hypothetical protein
MQMVLLREWWFAEVAYSLTLDLNHGVEPGKKNLYTDVTRDQTHNRPAPSDTPSSHIPHTDSYSTTWAMCDNHTLISVIQSTVRCD